MKFLISNVGSTSLKFKLYDMPGEALLCEGRVESVGSDADAVYTYKNPGAGVDIRKEGKSIPDYTTGIHMFLGSMIDPVMGVIGGVQELDGVVFKTVLAKGFYGVHLLEDQVLQAMEEYLFVAPVHNSAYLEAIKVFRKLLPDTNLVGVFETDFHTTIPLARRLYGVPYDWYERHGIMRLGYHGASHRYIAQSLEERYGATGKAISCHLGGSCSICAIREGESVDNSFGFSLQTGVIHATRTGDADPYLFPFLQSRGVSLEDIHRGVGKEGGLLGISGVSGDLRKVEQAAAEGNERAALAVEMFVESILRYIGSYYVLLGGLDHLVFAGGIGENSASIRRRVCEKLAHLGILLDEEANVSGKGPRRISAPASKIDVLVLPTDEEIVLARQANAFLSQAEAAK